MFYVFAYLFYRSKNEIDNLFDQYTSLSLDEEEEAEIIYDQRKLDTGCPEGKITWFISIIFRYLKNMV